MTTENWTGHLGDPPFETHPPEGRVRLSEELKRKILAEEAFAVLLEMQRQDEKAGITPAFPWLFLRMGGRVLECLGGIVLGAFLASVALMANFFLFNYILHVQF